MENKIYVGQTKLTLSFDTNQDLTGATQTLIQYKKPDGNTGSWNGTIGIDSSILVWEPIDENDLDQAGKWTFWADVTFADSRRAVGKAVTIRVAEIGT